jgi:hypothetical protein
MTRRNYGLMTSIRKRGECKECCAPIPTWKLRCDECQDVRNKVRAVVARQCGWPTTRYRDDLTETHLYVVGVEQDALSPVKFGVSQDPKKRLKDMQVGSPYPIVIIGFMPANRGLELLVHRYLNCFRLYGEWFRRSEKTNGIIELICTNQPDTLLELVRVRRSRNQRVILQTENSSAKYI